MYLLYIISTSNKNLMINLLYMNVLKLVNNQMFYL